MDNILTAYMRLNTEGLNIGYDIFGKTISPVVVVHRSDERGSKRGLHDLVPGLAKSSSP
jgi:hypothetical protein